MNLIPTLRWTIKLKSIEENQETHLYLPKFKILDKWQDKIAVYTLSVHMEEISMGDSTQTINLRHQIYRE